MAHPDGLACLAKRAAGFLSRLLEKLTHGFGDLRFFKLLGEVVRGIIFAFNGGDADSSCQVPLQHRALRQRLRASSSGSYLGR